MNLRIPLVSVIIPTYNRANDLRRAIDSVLNQSFSDFELIIVDNNSRDETDSVLRSYSDERIRVYKIQNYGVIAASRNLGIQNSRGLFIAFLDSDDWWKKEKLKKSVKILNQGVDLVYHDLYRVTKANPSLFYFKLKSRDLMKRSYQDLIENGNAILNSSVVVKRSVIEKVGLLNQKKEFIAWEDFDLWLRISREGYVLKRMPECLGYYWQVNGNLSSEERSLNIFNAFLDEYSSELGKDWVPPWISFARGKIYYNMNKHEDAFFQFKNIKFSEYRFFWKSCIFRFLIFIKAVVKK